MRFVHQLALVTAISVALVACGAAMPERPAMQPTRRVAITGEHADTLGDTVGVPLDGHVLVHANDGRELWVREDALGAPTLTAGEWVLVAHEGGLVPAEVIEALDDYAEVRVADIVGYAPMHAIVAILHAPPSVPITSGALASADVASATATDGEAASADTPSAE